MVSHPADTLVSLGGQRVARAAATHAETASVRLPAHWAAIEAVETRRFLARAGGIPASEAEAWKDLIEALTDYGPRRDAVKASR